MERPVIERLSVTTAVVGLMAAGGNLTELLWDLNWAPHDETAAIHQVLQEVKQYRSSVHVFYKTLSQLEAGKLPFPERRNWIKVDDLVATLTDTVLAFSELQAIADTIDMEDSHEGVDVGPLYKRFDVPINALCSRIRWHNITITMMMTVLRNAGEADAQTSRTTLEQRMTRLLSSNTELSGRMRRLEDVFDARGNSESLPDYRASQANPAAAGAAPNPDVGRPAPGPGQAWSAFTGYTLADTPVLSIIALPVMTGELRDGSFYTFDFARHYNAEIAEAAPAEPSPDTTKKLATVLRQPSSDGKLWMGLASTVRKFNRRKRKKRDIASMPTEPSNDAT